MVAAGQICSEYRNKINVQTGDQSSGDFSALEAVAQLGRLMREFTEALVTLLPDMGSCVGSLVGCHVYFKSY